MEEKTDERPRWKSWHKGVFSITVLLAIGALVIGITDPAGDIDRSRGNTEGGDEPAWTMPLDADGEVELNSLLGRTAYVVLINSGLQEAGYVSASVELDEYDDKALVIHDFPKADELFELGRSDLLCNLFSPIAKRDDIAQTYGFLRFKMTADAAVVGANGRLSHVCPL